LSGCDLCVLLASADIRRASKALVFGVALNAGRTCIAPRTSLVHRSIFERATSQLTQAFDAMAALHVPDTRDTIRARRWIADALQRGAVALGAHDPLSQWPVLLTGVPRRHPLRTEDVFAPVLCVDAFEQLDDVLAVASDSEFALGMSIFGEESEARALAAQANVGCVCINDVIAPTADPRVPFSGRRSSGYGVTRGAEGLLEMTQVKPIVTQRSRSPLHLRRARQNDFSLLLAWTGLAHSRAQDRWTHLKQLLQSLRGHHD
ncbi:MAG TPA: aldehyde dehydrogenase family protein, partial [Terriglobales bacterium]